MSTTQVDNTRQIGALEAQQIYYVFTCEPTDSHPTQLDTSFSLRRWRPSTTRIVPPSLHLFHGLWWLAHYFRVFRNRDYTVYLVQDGDRVIHRSCVIPCYFRWPFMSGNDMQISSTWTDPDYRGAGIATATLEQIVHDLRRDGRRFWYVSRPENPASIAVCVKAGFTLRGTGQRRPRFGTQILGRFTVNMASREPRASEAPAFGPKSGSRQ